MHHEGAFQDRFAFRLMKQFEGVARQSVVIPRPENGIGTSVASTFHAWLWYRPRVSKRAEASF
jgi:hypothetical protein